MLNRKVHEQLPYPYSSCSIDSRQPQPYDSFLYNLIINSNYSYTQQFCFDQCYEKMVIEKCNCYDLVFVTLLKAKPCITNDEVNCTDDVWYKYTKTDKNELCGRLCPLGSFTIFKF